MNCRLCLLNCGLIVVCGRQSLQDSAFPGGSLGTSVCEVALLFELWKHKVTEITEEIESLY